MQILIIVDFPTAVEKIQEILYEKVDRKTVLFLSGGTMQKSLYAALARDRIIKPAAVGLVDEQFGKKLHQESTELMIQETGLWDYFAKQNISFYPIITKKISRKKTAELYDKTTRDLFFHFQKSVAIMDIGSDGSTAGIIPNRKDFIDPLFDESKKQLFVGEYRDEKSNFKERVSMTFAGLSLIDYFIILAFGKEKRKALHQMFTPGSLEDIPARFFMQQAPNNTIIITDQQV